MTTTSDPWSASRDEHEDRPQFSPFSLLSCKKVHEARGLNRRKLHLAIYAVLALCHSILISYSIWLFLSEPGLLNRSDLLFFLTELFVVVWMFNLVLNARDQPTVFHYKFHLFVVVITRSFLWSLLIAMPIFIWAALKPNLGLFAWYTDDLLLLWNFLSLVILIQGARYFRKGESNV